MVVASAVRSSSMAGASVALLASSGLSWAAALGLCLLELAGGCLPPASSLHGRGQSRDGRGGGQTRATMMVKQAQAKET